MAGGCMPRIHAGVALALCAVAAIAAFAIGRARAPAKPVAAPGDLGARVRAALGEGDELTRLGQAAILLENLDPSTLPEVLAVYDEMLPVLGQWEIRPFVAAWARFDPAGALDHTLGWPFKPKREIGVEAAMEGWALRDPAAARHAFEQASAQRPGLGEPLLLGLLAGWVHSGQAGLESYVAGLPPATQDAATSIVAGALVRKGGADAALAWADAILRDETGDGGFKQSVFRRATRS